MNDRKDRNVFEIEKGVVQEPERVDQSEMTVEEIADGVYHVGQDGIYSTFIDQETGLVGLGAEGGFGDRLTSLREKTGNDRPLVAVLVADHHEDEYEGARDAIAEGAKLIIPKLAQGKLDTMFSDTIVKPRYEIVEDQLQMGDLTIHNIQTSHAERLLVVHHEESGSLFQSSHYISPYPNERFIALRAAVNLHDELVKLGLNIDRVLSSGSRKPETWDDFSAAAQTSKLTKCHNSRRICRP